MELYKKVLEAIRLPLALWKRENNSIRCIFTNNRISNLKKDDILDGYIKDFDIEYKDMFNKAFNSEQKQTDNYIGELIIINKLNDDVYSEIHYPKCDDMYLLYSISNKIRNPLTNIVGILSIVDEFNLTEDEKKYINIIKKSSYDIVSLANDIIDIVNLEKNKVQLFNEKIILSNIIVKSCEVIEDLAKDKNIALNYKIGDDVPEIINIDKIRLQQIIVNFLNNALLFTKVGAISIDVSLFKKDNTFNCPFKYIENDDKYNILFKIKDTGAGIDTDKKNAINKILNIKNIKNVKSYRNFGFGLLISRYLCNLMGGNIWFKSEKDMGTIFYFNIICDGINVD